MNSRKVARLSIHNTRTYCRGCLNDLKKTEIENGKGTETRELEKWIYRITGTHIDKTELETYPHSMCAECIRKTKKFYDVRKRAICSTEAIKGLLSEVIPNNLVHNLQLFCRICLLKLKDSETIVNMDRVILVRNWLFKLISTYENDELMTDDENYPKLVCNVCYKELESSIEFSKQAMMAFSTIRSLLSPKMKYCLNAKRRNGQKQKRADKVTAGVKKVQKVKGSEVNRLNKTAVDEKRKKTPRIKGGGKSLKPIPLKEPKELKQPPKTIQKQQNPATQRNERKLPSTNPPTMKRMTNTMKPPPPNKPAPIQRPVMVRTKSVPAREPIKSTPKQRPPLIRAKSIAESAEPRLRAGLESENKKGLQQKTNTKKTANVQPKRIKRTVSKKIINSKSNNKPAPEKVKRSARANLVPNQANKTPRTRAKKIRTKQFIEEYQPNQQVKSKCKTNESILLLTKININKIMKAFHAKRTQEHQKKNNDIHNGSMANNPESCMHCDCHLRPNDIDFNYEYFGDEYNDKFQTDFKPSEQPDQPDQADQSKKPQTLIDFYHPFESALKCSNDFIIPNERQSGGEDELPQTSDTSEYICDICDQEFNDLHQLKVHLEKHDDISQNNIDAAGDPDPEKSTSETWNVNCPKFCSSLSHTSLKEYQQCEKLHNTKLIPIYIRDCSDCHKKFRSAEEADKEGSKNTNPKYKHIDER